MCRVHSAQLLQELASSPSLSPLSSSLSLFPLPFFLIPLCLLFPLAKCHHLLLARITAKDGILEGRQVISVLRWEIRVDESELSTGGCEIGAWDIPIMMAAQRKNIRESHFSLTFIACTKILSFQSRFLLSLHPTSISSVYILAVRIAIIQVFPGHKARNLSILTVSI